MLDFLLFVAVSVAIMAYGEVRTRRGMAPGESYYPGLAAVIGLLVLPAVIFIAYSSLIRPGVNWLYVWGNYLWCSVMLYAVVGVLSLRRARRSTQVVALVWGNLALVAFCGWMLSLLARGGTDLAIGWVFLFPVQLAAILVGLLAQRIYGMRRTAPVRD